MGMASLEAALEYNAFISYSHAVDGKLAPALQSAVCRFALPWYRRAVIHIFCDRTDLSISPGLWSSIERALEQCAHFILLASPKAAASKWVRREIAFWLTQRSPDTLLIVLTEGGIAWDDIAKDFDWQNTDALPDSLAKIFGEEPLYLDLRSVSRDQHLTQDNTIFRDGVATLAALLRGRSKDELIGEDVLVRRRARRVAWSVGISLFVLTILLALSRQQLGQSLARSEREARIATAERLAAQSSGLLADYPQRALLLAVQGVHATDPDHVWRPTAHQALLNALNNCTGYGLGGHDSPVSALTISPDSHWLATASDTSIRLWDLAAEKPLAGPSLPIGEHLPWWTLTVSPDSRWLLAAAIRPVLWNLTDVDPRLTARELQIGGTRLLAVTFSPDGRWLAATIADGTTRVWDVTAGSHPVVLHDHKEGTEIVKITPDGKWLVTAGAESTHMWSFPPNDSATPPIILQQGRHCHMVLVSADSRWLAQQTLSGGVEVWDLRAPEIQRMGVILAEGTGSLAESFMMSPDGRWLAAKNSGEPARVWDLMADVPGGRSFRLNNSREKLLAITSQALFTIDSGGTLRVSRLTDKQPWESPKVLPLSIGDVQSSVVSPDNNWLLLTGARTSLLLRNHTERAWRLRGYEGGVVGAAFSPDGRWLAVAGHDRATRLWPLDPDGPPRPCSTALKAAGDITRIAISSDGRWLVGSGRNSDGVPTTHLWSLAPGQHELRGVELPTDAEETTAVAFSPDNRWLVIGGQNGSSRIWDVRGEEATNWLVLHGSGIGHVKYILFSKDSHWLAESFALGTVAGLWETADFDFGDADKLKAPAGFLPHHALITSMAISTDSRWLATGDSGGTARLWPIKGGRLQEEAVLSFNDHRRIDQIYISPRNRWLVAAGTQVVPKCTHGDDECGPYTSPVVSEGSIKLWDLTVSARRHQAVELSVNLFIDGLLITPNDRWLLTYGSTGGHAKLMTVGEKLSAQGILPGKTELQAFDLYAPEIAASKVLLGRYDGMISCTGMSSDGHWLAAGSLDGSVRIWDLLSSDIPGSVVELGSHSGSVYSLAFTPDGKHLATGGADGKVVLWSIEHDALLECARQAVGRNLDADEWRQYFADTR